VTTIIRLLVGVALSVSSHVNATQPAVRVAETVGPPAPTDPPAPVGGKCAEWADLAFSVGWPQDEWPTIDRVMWCESRCSPTAYNRSTSSGLMQVLRRYFGPGEDPLDPSTNLAVALRVWRAQGWRAWSCY
jgi:hypothetical protein